MDRQAPAIRFYNQAYHASCHIGQPETSSDTPFVNYWFAVGLLVIIAGATGLSSECMVQSLNKLMAQAERSPRPGSGSSCSPWLATVPEHATAWWPPGKGISIYRSMLQLGSALQIAACVFPFTLLLIWRLGKEGGNFALVQILILVVVGAVTHLFLQQGKNNWFKGIFLLACFCVFSLIAIVT
jgi:Ca2+/H+ antiporter